MVNVDCGWTVENQSVFPWRRAKALRVCVECKVLCSRCWAGKQGGPALKQLLVKVRWDVNT